MCNNILSWNKCVIDILTSALFIKKLTQTVISVTKYLLIAVMCMPQSKSVYLVKRLQGNRRINFLYALTA